MRGQHEGESRMIEVVVVVVVEVENNNTSIKGQQEGKSEAIAR